MVMDNMHKNLVKFSRMVFELYERTDRHTVRETDRQTDVLITILRNPKWVKYLNHNRN